MFENEVVIDCKGHLLGRLASTVAKELLCGQKVVCVRTEKINISGSLYRNKLKYEEFRRKRMNTNPKKGPYHFRAPSKILWRSIRGMIPHKTARGQMALLRFKAFEGTPHPYCMKKRKVIPQALKCLRLKPHRKFCVLGDLAQKVGWKNKELIERLSAKRATKQAAWYAKKKAANKARNTAFKAIESKLGEHKAILESTGFSK